MPAGSARRWSTAIQEKFEQVRISAVREFVRIESQVHVNAAHLWYVRLFQQEIRHPAANNHKTVFKRRQHLAKVNENGTSGSDLARTVVVPLAPFGIHNKPRTFQARLRFCSSNASAASSPRPPQ
jgi:hypothetical protein